MVELEAYDYGRCYKCDGPLTASVNTTTNLNAEPEVRLTCWFCEEQQGAVPLSQVPERFPHLH